MSMYKDLESIGTMKASWSRGGKSLFLNYFIFIKIFILFILFFNIFYVYINSGTKKIMKLSAKLVVENTQKYAFICCYFLFLNILC